MAQLMPLVARLTAFAVLGTGLFTLPNLAASAPAKPSPTLRKSARARIERGFLQKTIKQGGEEYKYVLYVPADYDASKPYPTIIFLNGAGECGRDGWKHVATGLGPAIMKDPDKWPFLVLLPQKPDVRTNWEDHDALVMAMLDVTRKNYKVDPDRLYLTGLSQGGHGTWAIGAKHADLFAALAPVCGWADLKTATDLKSLPIWTFHGDADPAVPIKASQDMTQAVKDAGGDVTLTVYPGVGHNSWDNAYGKEGLNDWFLKQVRKSK